MEKNVMKKSDERYDKNENLKESFVDSSNGIEYKLVGDYYYPNLEIKAKNQNKFVKNKK